MATVLIPENGRGDNPLTIYINGVKTTLARGEEISVSDAVAAEIAALNGELLPVAETPAGDGAHLPTVTEADDDKVLMVVDGEWVAADPGDGLPAVTAADDGKVLMVVDGEWGLGDGGSGGGGGVLVVHDSNGTPYSSDGVLDKTWKEIHDAEFAVLKSQDGAIFSLNYAGMVDGYYVVGFGDSYGYSADNENKYPAYGMTSSGVGDGGDDSTEY